MRSRLAQRLRAGISPPALAGFVAYAGLAIVLGEVWPLSRFPMYAFFPKDGAVPVMRVDGEPTDPEAMVDFHGCTAEQIRIPRGVTHRVGWRLDEIAHWVRAHTAETPGPVTVRFGYQRLRAPPEGPRLDPTFEELCVGTARRGP